MAIEVKTGGNGKLYWYDTSSRTYYAHEPVQIGDTVEYVGTRSSTFSKGSKVIVTRFASNLYVENIRLDGAYNYVYNQNFYHAGDNQARSMANWRKAAPVSTILALESNDPVFVQEFKEVLKDGESVRENIGDVIPMKNLSAARIYTSNEISESIRATNTYRQFEIYKFQRLAIARAKKPEIEFA